MDLRVIKYLQKKKQIRKRSIDKERIKSMVESSIRNMEVVNSIVLTEKSALLVFRETYESIRQLGDACWWLLGFEPKNHEISLDILRGLDIKEKGKLELLPRFRALRNDANYRGFKVSIEHANEILDFWDSCTGEIINSLRKTVG